MKVGAFSAGSNLTGNIFNADKIAVICHKYGVLACLDYAAVAPYVNINMNGETDLNGIFDPLPQKD